MAVYVSQGSKWFAHCECGWVGELWAFEYSAEIDASEHELACKPF